MDESETQQVTESDKNDSDDDDRPVEVQTQPHSDSYRPVEVQDHSKGDRPIETQGTTINVNRGRPRERGRGIGRSRPRCRGAGTCRQRQGRRARSGSPARVRGVPDLVWQQIENNRNMRQFAERTGPQRRYQVTTNELNFFEEFFTKDVWDLITTMTNMNAVRKIQNGNVKWKPVNTQEIKVFIGLVIAMGIIKLPKLELYWQKRKWFFDIPSFNKVMARDRFYQIWRYLHFCDETKAPQNEDPNRDKLYKIRPLLTKVLHNFESNYVPDKILSIDESMIPFKGRIGFRQFIQSKRTRFGIKVWVLAESNTGYIPRLQIYTGKDRENEPGEVGQGMRVVNDLIVPYEHKGYHLYVDNFYTSPELFKSLFDRDVYACGTLRKGRRGFPVDIIIEQPLRHERGYTKWTMCGPVLA